MQTIAKLKSLYFKYALALTRLAENSDELRYTWMDWWISTHNPLLLRMQKIKIRKLDLTDF